MKVCFETFGCRLNRAEALEEEAKYIAAGWSVTEKHSEADRFVVRGCSVTSRAQHECEHLVEHLRRHYPNTRVVVQGCMSKKTDKRSSSPVHPGHATTPDGEPPVPTRTARAYLKVQDGCTGKCTFCIVPQFRGASKSTDFTAVLDRARRFIDAGYHEIVVTGCNLSLYASQGKRLPDLLAALSELGQGSTPDETCRIRLGSIEPGACARETVDVMASHDNICRFLHVTVQSGSNNVLRAMMRPYQRADIDRLIQEAVAKMPAVGLGCDIMTGFPGEMAPDFLSTQTLLEQYPFSNCHVFPYSERPGTQAVNYPGSIPKDERSQRAHALAEIMTEKRRMAAKKFIGKEVEVLIEDEANQAGWTSEYFWYKRSSDQPGITVKTPRKSIAKIRVTGYRHGHLI